MTLTQRSPEVQALWERLERFQLNDNQAVYGYADRLARENGWSHCYAERVIFEYKRFLLMTQYAGHPVTPSEEVDQAWHLHMVYTRSYWEKLCVGVLGKPLHHEPTVGGVDEGAKFRRQYERTLQIYERLFGEPAPPDVWPPMERRFQPMSSRWVDVSRHWLLPKPRWVRKVTPHSLRVPVAAILTAGLLVGCQSVAQMLDMRGGEFLQFYLTGMGVALIMSWLLPRFAGSGASRRPETPTDLYDIAFLGGGSQRVLDAALTVLYGRELVTTVAGSDAAKLTAKQMNAIPDDLHPVEVRVLRAVPVHLGTTMKGLWLSLRPLFKEFEERMSAAGMVEDASSKRWLQLLAALPWLALMAVGGTKVVIGMGRDRPVGFLVVLLIVSLFLLLWRIGRSRHRTSGGEAVWKGFRKQPPVNRAEMERLGTLADPAQVALLVALTGYAALESTGYGALHAALYRRPQADSGGSGCSSSSSSGCSSSDSGGSSGCGSSGCGGCGGGGGD